MAAPRVILAVVIGLVVSTPLTLQIFKAEIDAELIQMHTEELEAFEDRLDSDPRFRDVDAMKAEISELELAVAAGAPADAVSANPEVAALTQQLAQVSADYDVAEQDVACEKDGTCGSGVVGAGPAFDEKVARRDRLAGEVTRLQSALDAKTAEVRQSVSTSTEQAAISNQARIDDLREQVTDAEGKRDAEVTAHDATTESNDGLLVRLEALHRLTTDNWILQFAHILLFLFLTAIECLPILFKTLLALAKPTLYEQLTQMEDDRGIDRARLRLDIEQAEAMSVAQASLEAAKVRSATQLDAEVRTAQTVLDAQVDLAGKAVTEWKRRETARIASEIDEFGVEAVLSAPQLPHQDQRR